MKTVNERAENREKTFLKICWICFLHLLKFTLLVLENAHTEIKRKKYEPTLEELSYGQKMAMSDRYFIPEKNIRKR